METINPVAEVFSYKRGKGILWLKDKRKAYTGTFQSEFKAGTLEEIADKSASDKPKPASIPAGEWKFGGKWASVMCSTANADTQGQPPFPVR